MNRSDAVDPVSAEVIRSAMETVVSLEGARRDYRVALRGRVEAGTLEIDLEETRRLRAAGRGGAVA